VTRVVAAVLDLALARPPKLGRTRLVCVDGPAGSGKTTFADRLVQEARGRGLTVELVHMDDVFEGWDGLADAGARVRDQVVGPLGRGRPGRYARYDWEHERLGDEVTVPVADLLVIEGVGSADPGYAQHTSALVWVWAPRELRLERGLARDGAALEDRWRTWMLDEEQLHLRDRTEERADVVVDGRSGELSLGPTAGA
jgi:uridine kinase